MEEKKIVKVKALQNFNDMVAGVDRVKDDIFECDMERAVYLSDCTINGVKYYLVEILEDEVVIDSNDIVDPADVNPEDVVNVSAEKVTKEETTDETENSAEETAEDTADTNVPQTTNETAEEETVAPEEVETNVPQATEETETEKEIKEEVVEAKATRGKKATKTEEAK